MKVAVTSRDKNIDSQMDPRFGRAAYILLVDSESLEVEVLDNSENANSFKGAGIQAAAMLGDKGVEVLLTGFCGPNAFRTLQAAGVKVVNNMSGPVKDALKALNEGRLAFAEDANADAHW